MLDLSALGRKIGPEIENTLSAAQPGGPAWLPEFFDDDLFVAELVKSCFTLTVAGRNYPANWRFLRRTLGHVPTDLAVTRFRQKIVRELDEDPEILANVERLYIALFDLVSLHKTPSYQTDLDVAAFHLDILRQAQVVVDLMAETFANATSGLRRLHVAGEAIRESEEYGTLVALLGYESALAHLHLDVKVGADGRIRSFDVQRLEENQSNPFYTNPLRRLVDRARLLFNGYPMSSRELTNRLINEIYRRLSPHFVPMVQLIGHLEFYLSARSFRDRVRDLGLETSLADFDDSRPMALEGLFNPLLMKTPQRPVPCSLVLEQPVSIAIITGPNSGGKTRLLQAVALAQLLGQSGIYTPARRANLRPRNGLFVSLVEDESADQTEGRLGRELVRIRSLFEEMSLGSLVVLDELCSGTNPSEGIEVFEMVLELLREVEPIALVTTHFLDFARGLAEGAQEGEFEFFQVKVDDRQRSTYQFEPGVAETSLASVTAERLGVTFDRLSKIIRSRDT